MPPARSKNPAAKATGVLFREIKTGVLDRQRKVPLRLPNADVYRTPRKHAWRDRYPRPCSAAVPVRQVHPFVMPEAAEAEAPSVLEKIAANDATMTDVDISATLSSESFVVAITAKSFMTTLGAKIFAAPILAIPVVQGSIATLLIVHCSALPPVIHTVELRFPRRVRAIVVRTYLSTMRKARWS